MNIILRWSTSNYSVLLAALLAKSAAFQSPGAAVARSTWSAHAANYSFDVFRLNASAATEFVADALAQPVGPILELPLDADTESYVEQARAPHSAFYILAGLMAVAISPLLFQRGLAQFLVALVYLASLSSMKTLIKLSEDNGLALPLFTTFMHAVTTCVVSGFIASPKRSEAIPVIPVALAAGGSFVVCNEALMHAGVAFVTMVGCCTPAITLSVQLFRNQISASLEVVLPIIVVISGSLVCVTGETSASVLGLILSLSTAVLRSAKAIMMQECLAKDTSSINLSFWVAFWSGVSILPVAAFSEGPQLMSHLRSANQLGVQAFLASCCVACSLNITQCFVVKMLGAVHYNVIGNLNLIVVTMIAVTFLHEVVTPVQYIGLSVLVCGALAASQSFREVVKAELVPETEKVPLINQMCSNSNSYTNIPGVKG